MLARYVPNQRLADALYLQAFASLTASPGARAYYDTRRAAGYRPAPPSGAGPPLATRSTRPGRPLIVAHGDPVTFVTVSQRSGIPRVTLYRNPALRALVEEHRAKAQEATTLTGLAAQLASQRLTLQALAAKPAGTKNSSASSATLKAPKARRERVRPPAGAGPPDTHRSGRGRRESAALRATWRLTCGQRVPIVGRRRWRFAVVTGGCFSSDVLPAHFRAADDLGGLESPRRLPRRSFRVSSGLCSASAA